MAKNANFWHFFLAFLGFFGGMTPKLWAALKLVHRDTSSCNLESKTRQTVIGIFGSNKKLLKNSQIICFGNHFNQWGEIF